MLAAFWIFAVACISDAGYVALVGRVLCGGRVKVSDLFETCLLLSGQAFRVCKELLAESGRFVSVFKPFLVETECGTALFGCNLVQAQALVSAPVLYLLLLPLRSARLKLVANCKTLCKSCCKTTHYAAAEVTTDLTMGATNGPTTGIKLAAMPAIAPMPPAFFLANAASAF